MYDHETVNLGILDLKSKDDTGREMVGTVDAFFSDLGGYLSWPLSAWFDFVGLIPYESDEERFPERVIELVPRPLYLLDRYLFPRIDCKKKAILIASWAKGNGYDFRFLAVSHRIDKKIHHVFPQVDLGNGWINADATFPFFRLGEGQPITRAEELTK